MAGKIYLTGFTGVIEIKLVDSPQATTAKPAVEGGETEQAKD